MVASVIEVMFATVSTSSSFALTSMHSWHYEIVQGSQNTKPLRFFTLLCPFGQKSLMQDVLFCPEASK